MIQILIPSIRSDINGVLDSIRANTTLPYVIMVIREGNSYAEAVNGTEVIGDWVVFAADDVRFYPNWDTEFMKCHEQTGKMVIGTNDLHHPGVIDGTSATHWIVKKEYLDTYGGTIDRSFPLVYNYLHNYVDAEAIETAKFHNQYAFCKTCILEHIHPAWGLAPMDEAYRKWEYSVPIDQKTFESRQHLWSTR